MHWNVVFVVLLMLVRSCFLFHKTILNECAQIEANSPWKYGPNTFYGNEYTDSFKARKFYYQVRLKEARYGKIPIRTLGFTSGLPCHMIFQYSGTNIWYALLTKLVRPRWLDIGRVLFFFRVFTDWDEVVVHKNAKREWGQYTAILTEQACSIKDGRKVSLC